MAEVFCFSALKFQSTPPARGATPAVESAPRARTRFNPRPPRGGRRYSSMACCGISSFQSTPPARGATAGRRTCRPGARVSIHAPRAGGDTRSRPRWARRSCFNPRPPRGGRQRAALELLGKYLFQSTPPARGATPSINISIAPAAVSIHAPRAGGDSGRRLRSLGFGVSIHAPRAGGDAVNADDVLRQLVSIHAPRAGGDLGGMAFRRRAGVSIHAPRAGGDLIRQLQSLVVERFNPRPPRGGRRQRADSACAGCEVSIHAPRAGGD